MADFSGASTEIAPSDVGASPVVQQRSPVLQNTSAASFATLGATLAVGVKDYLAGEQLKAQNAVVADYSRKQAGINSALDQGTISPQEAHVRSNTLNNESIAAYPALAEQFGKQYSVFNSTTSLGDANKENDSAIKQAQAIKEKQAGQAIAQGWDLPSDINDPAYNVIIHASTTAQRAEYQFDQMKKKSDFDRSTNTYNQTQDDRSTKQASEQLVGQIFTDSWDGLHAQLSSLRQKALSGEIPWQDAQFKMNKLLSDTTGVIQQATIRNPELAGPYKGLIDNLSTFSKDYLNPEKDSAILDAQYKDSITRGKISAISDPQVRSAAVASSLFGNNNAILSAYNAQGVVRTVTQLANNTVTNGKPAQFSPAVIGAAEESDVYKALKEGVDTIKAGKNNTPKQGWQEGSNTVNNIMVQAGQITDSGNAKVLKPAADFFASSQFLELQKNGALDPASLQAAKKTFQVVYGKAVRDSIGTQLNVPVNVADKSVPSSDLIDVQMVNGAPTFVPKKGIDQPSTDAANAKIKSLTQYQQGLNQTVRIGAHMEGTSDYQKYWNDNKYSLMPQLYPVKPGQVVDGFKWSGDGDWKDKSTWTRTGGAR